jgi:hypothetical protein
VPIATGPLIRSPENIAKGCHTPIPPETAWHALPTYFFRPSLALGPSFALAVIFIRVTLGPAIDPPVFASQYTLQRLDPQHRKHPPATPSFYN